MLSTKCLLLLYHAKPNNLCQTIVRWNCTQKYATETNVVHKIQHVIFCRKILYRKKMLIPEAVNQI
jgi:hypothetical protein